MIIKRLPCSEKEGRRYLLEHLNESNTTSSTVRAGSMTHPSPAAHHVMTTSPQSTSSQQQVRYKLRLNTM